MIIKTICLSLLLLTTTVLGYGDASFGSAAPDFYPTVKFDKNDPAGKFSNTRNTKAHFILFVQNTPKDIAEAKKCIPLFEKAHAAKQGIVNFIILQTDTTSASSAKKFAKSLGANLDFWLVGADPGGSYMTFFLPSTDTKWYYLIIKPDGTKGNFSSFLMNRSPRTSNYQSVQDSVWTDPVNYLRKAKPYMVVDYTGVPNSLKKYCEYGELGLAVNLLAKLRQAAKDDKLHIDLETAINKKVAARCQSLIGRLEGSNVSAQFVASLEAGRLSKTLKTNPDVKTLRSPLLKAQKNPDYKKELAAYKKLPSMIKLFSKVKPKDRPAKALPKLKAFIEKYKGTYAAKTVKQMASSIPEKK